MKYFLIGLAVLAIFGSFFAGMNYGERKVDNVMSAKDSIYKHAVDSMNNRSDSIITAFNKSQEENDSIKKVNKDLKRAYEKEKNSDFTHVFNSPIDSTVKYWSTEFSKIGKL